MSEQTVEQHRDELIDRLSEAIRRLNAAEARNRELEIEAAHYRSSVTKFGLDAALARVKELEAERDQLRETVERLNTFWVIEQFTDGKSQGYWFGNSSRDFSTDIGRAIQFRRKEDASKIMLSWHWKDTQVTEHMYIDTSIAEPTELEQELQYLRNNQRSWIDHAKGFEAERDQLQEQLAVRTEQVKRQSYSLVDYQEDKIAREEFIAGQGQRLCELREQRDKLLVALKKIHRISCPDCDSPEIAEAAIRATALPATQNEDKCQTTSPPKEV